MIVKKFKASKLALKIAYGVAVVINGSLYIYISFLIKKIRQINKGLS